MKKKKRKNNIKYSKLVILGSLLLFCLIIGRVLQLGLSTEVDDVNLKELASKRTTKTETIVAERGDIYSRNGDLLAQNVASYKLIAYLSPKRTTDKKKPQHVIDKEDTAEKLAPILGMEKDEVLKHLNKENVYQTEFGTKGKGLNEITKKKIEDLNLPGLAFIETFKRYYPKGDFASYTIGYTRTDPEDDDSIKGEMGIEKQYNEILKGKNGSITYQKDLKGYKIANTPVIEDDAVQGKDVYLTLDSNIQFFVEQAMKTEDITYDWEWFNITLLDAKTGAVLATSSSPSFDPNKRDISNYLNLLVSSPYEPGSTMKTFTYMAAMENGVYDGGETYKSGTFVTSDGTEIGDWDRNGWGVISFDKGYAMSSNVGVINMINRHMSSVMLRQYFRQLGFGRKTGIELPDESKGKLDFRYETEIYNAGFGQGITTTPIQNVKAMSPLTNDGMLLEPYIVEKIVDENGEVVLQNERSEIERVASTNTVQKMLSLMDDCVNGWGNTGSGYRLDSGELIGKTGTAQISNEKGGGYMSGKEDIISSFSGIYPKSNPQVIIYASVKRPSGGSQKPVSNAVKEIVQNISKYYGNSDSAPSGIVINNYTVPNFKNKKLDNAKVTLESSSIPYIVLGSGSKVVDQYPNRNDIITPTDTVYLITNDSNLTIPNVVGLSSKKAKAILQKLGLKVNLDGVGYVTSQSVPEGTIITPNMEVNLSLAIKYSIE